MPALINASRCAIAFQQRPCMMTSFAGHGDGLATPTQGTCPTATGSHSIRHPSTLSASGGGCVGATPWRAARRIAPFEMARQGLLWLCQLIVQVRADSSRRAASQKHVVYAFGAQHALYFRAGTVCVQGSDFEKYEATSTTKNTCCVPAETYTNASTQRTDLASVQGWSFYGPGSRSGSRSGS